MMVQSLEVKVLNLNTCGVLIPPGFSHTPFWGFKVYFYNYQRTRSIEEEVFKDENNHTQNYSRP